MLHPPKENNHMMFSDSLRLLSEAELQVLTERFTIRRDAFASGELPDGEHQEPEPFLEHAGTFQSEEVPFHRRPALADFYNHLLIALDDERRRRAAEAEQFKRMMRTGDRPVLDVQTSWGKPPPLPEEQADG